MKSLYHSCIIARQGNPAICYMLNRGKVFETFSQIWQAGNLNSLTFRQHIRMRVNWSAIAVLSKTFDLP